MFLEIQHCFLIFLIFSLFLLFPLGHLIVGVAASGLFSEEGQPRLVHGEHIFEDEDLIEPIGRQAELVFVGDEIGCLEVQV